MVSNFAILTNIFILFASGVLAIPSSGSQLEAHHVRHHENRQSKPINRIDVLDGTANDIQYSYNWAGAVREEGKGTFTTVTGTFTVPSLKGPDGSAAAWVGIDGDTCGNAILQTGVDFIIKDGKSSYGAWYEWYPDYAYHFHKFNIKAGDEVRTTVIASSKTSGKVIIENLSTNKTVTKELSSSYALCEQDAEWIVEYFDQSVSFVDFGTLMFTNATASGTRGRIYTPVGATIADIQQGDVLTSVSVSGDTVTIKRV